MKVPAFLQARTFWLGAGIVLAAKVGWLLWYGVLYEFDSFGYLTLQADLLHPPGYNAFCAFWMKLTGRPESITFAQTLLFSLAVSHAAHHWITKPALQLAALALIGLDPCTGLLCADLMSEVFFLSLCLPLLVVAGQLRQSQGPWPWGKLLFAGALLGCLLWIRHAALIVWAALLVAFLLSKLPWRQRLLLPLVMMVVAQLLQLPLKLYYHQQFGTWQTSAYAGYSLWGSAAHLFPGSSVAKNPTTDFERFAATFPNSAYTIDNSLSTAHLFSGALPLQSYVAQRQLSTTEQMDLSVELNATAKQLILERPAMHLTRFVLPNLHRPFFNREWVNTQNLDSEIPAEWNLQRTRETVYEPACWWPWALLLLGSMLLLFIRWKAWRGDSALWLMIWWVAANWLASQLVGAVFLRYMFFLTPLIALMVARQVDILLLKRKAISATLTE
jgi:hypothetical protein